MQGKVSTETEQKLSNMQKGAVVTLTGVLVDCSNINLFSILKMKL